jgi:hypothetical protein
MKSKLLQKKSSGVNHSLEGLDGQQETPSSNLVMLPFSGVGPIVSQDSGAA